MTVPVAKSVVTGVRHALDHGIAGSDRVRGSRGVDREHAGTSGGNAFDGKRVATRVGHPEILATGLRNLHAGEQVVSDPAAVTQFVTVSYST